MLVDCFQCNFNILVATVVDGVECIVAKYVARHQCLDLGENDVARDVDVIPASRHPILGGIRHEIHKQRIVVRQSAQELLIVFQLSKLSAIVVGLAISIFLHKTGIEHSGII